MMHTIHNSSSVPSGQRPVAHRRTRRAAILTSIVLVGAAAACSDTAVPYYDAPTSISNSPTGIQNAVTGLFSGMRNDVYYFANIEASFGRDVFWFVTSAPPVLTIPGGLSPVAPGNFTFNNGWDNEYQMIRAANTIISNLPKVSSYSAAQQAAVAGVAQTEKALAFMYLAETRDTIGIPLYSMDGNPSDPPYCNMDVWRYIVALLDSGLADLDQAGPIPLPIALPPGFAAVSQAASPSTATGSFAAFNRALAGKAGLELAYAIARNSPATHPTPASAGSPDLGALGRADSAVTASALYNLAAIAPPSAGPFQPGPYIVYSDYSGASGDLPNAIFNAYFNYNALWDLQFDVDTLNDLRWKAKFVPDPNPVQIAQYAGVSDAKNFLPYSSVAAPIPIIRAEGLALVRAQIQLGLGNFAAAINLINTVHQQAGGFAGPLTIAPTYTAVRDSLLKEQRISMVQEVSGDRMIALRMYHLEAVADTTWQATSGPDAVVANALGATDYHTTVTSFPTSEADQRGGAWTLSCP
jgi:hypothetical protein